MHNDVKMILCTFNSLYMQMATHIHGIKLRTCYIYLLHLLHSQCAGRIHNANLIFTIKHFENKYTILFVSIYVYCISAMISVQACMFCPVYYILLSTMYTISFCIWKLFKWSLEHAQSYMIIWEITVLSWGTNAIHCSLRYDYWNTVHTSQCQRCVTTIHVVYILHCVTHCMYVYVIWHNA